VNKNYWLRGGIIAVVALIVAGILDVVLQALGSGAIVAKITSVLFSPAFVLNRAMGVSNTFISVLVVSIPVWFIIGSILGFLYGKIKK
jgi:hypothetical protein